MSVSEYSKERLSGPIWVFSIVFYDSIFGSNFLLLFMEKNHNISPPIWLNNMDLLANEGELIGPWVLYGI